MPAAAALRANFIPHWGPVWVAGHRLAIPAGGVASFEHLVPGRFRVDAARPVFVDGARVVPGGEVALSVGRHEVRVEGGGEVTLRTVEAGAAPTQPPPRARLFRTLTGR